MKEFALKHPWLTFILVDITAYNIFNVINNVLRVRAMNNAGKAIAKVNEEANTNESTGDIQ